MGTIDDVLAETEESLSERRVVERSMQVKLNGALPLSDILRDDTQTSGTGAVTDSNSEFKVRHAASGDFARLSSASRGDYQPGTRMEAGIGIRMGSLPSSGDFEAVWGYFDMSLSGGSNTENIEDGLVFGHDTSGTFVELIKNGTSQHKTYEDSWNGTDVDVNLKDGQIFQIEFLYYGYGEIKWQIIEDDEAKTVHTHKPSNQTSLSSPNLQIGGLVKSSDTSEDISMFIGGRQVSCIGDYSPKGRVQTGRVEGKSIGTSFEPLLSLRKKSSFRQVVVDLFGFVANSDGDAIIQVRSGSDITGGTSPSFGSLDEQPDGETALELDTSATAVDTSTGVKLFETVVQGGGGSDKQNLTNIGDIPTGIPDEGTITFAMKSLTGSSITVDFVGRLIERW